jgi:uncharacterized protein (TIGR03032 family)
MARAGKRPMSPRATRLESNNAAWRAPAQILAHWADARPIDPAALTCRVRGPFWPLLRKLGVILLVSREYEHFVVALNGEPRAHAQSFLPLPHPGGIAPDHNSGLIHIASTRNPNAVFHLAPLRSLLPRKDQRLAPLRGTPLLPVSCDFFPGCLYLHDLVHTGKALLATATGINALVQLKDHGTWTPRWWPRSIERRGSPDFARNLLQLNSVAWGGTIAKSFFTASCAAPTRHPPGHENFDVDGTGVVFSGRSRALHATGLTRPHAARFDPRGRLWLANSGRGEVLRITPGGIAQTLRLPGWTRGLAFVKNIGFAGVSRVLPRFAHYAPGLDPALCQCGVYAFDTASGKVLAALEWPAGNQIFAVEAVPAALCSGLPFTESNDNDIADWCYAFEAHHPRKKT